MGLLTMSVCALVATLAPAADASGPEWGRCLPQKRGIYADPSCQTTKLRGAHPKGHFEWEPGPAPDCAAVKHGFYSDAACTVGAERRGRPKGKYERLGGGRFQGTGGPVELTTAVRTCEPNLWIVEDCATENPEGGGFVHEETMVVECTREASSGEVSSATTVSDVEVRFSGCGVFGVPATSEGAAEGEVVTSRLCGRLGYINKGNREVGVSLTPEVEGQAFATLDITGLIEIEVGAGSPTFGIGTAYPGGGGDSIISPIAPVDVMSSTFTQTFAEGSEGQQMPEALEGGPLEELEAKFDYLPVLGRGSMWSRSAQSFTGTVDVGTPEEIRAGA